MNRRLELLSIVLFALNAGVVGGGVTSSLADEVPESRWTSAICAAKFCRSLRLGVP